MAAMLKIIFWVSVGVIGYAYVGYPVLIFLLSSLFKKEVRKGSGYAPGISIIICAFNEEKVIREKLENTIGLDYPPDKKQIVVVADGSTDKTRTICEEYAGRVTLMWAPERRGKVHAMNRGIGAAKGEIILFTDANSFPGKAALSLAAQYFADPEVGGVSGEKQVISRKGEGADGEGLYWKYESFLKKCDSAFYSLVGAPGEFFAVRKELYEDPGQDALIEDFIVSMRVAMKGCRIVYAPEIVATEMGVMSKRDEFVRRRRITAGGVQSVLRLAGLWNVAKYGRLSFSYISHRVLRWVVTPFLFPLMFAVSAALLFMNPHGFYLLAFAAQIIFYGLALAGLREGRRNRLVAMCFQVCFLNFSALAGFYRYITDTQPILWEKAAR